MLCSYTSKTLVDVYVRVAKQASQTVVYTVSWRSSQLISYGSPTSMFVTVQLLCSQLFSDALTPTVSNVSANSAEIAIETYFFTLIHLTNLDIMPTNHELLLYAQLFQNYMVR